MTRLTELRNRLAKLQRRRRNVRWETAYSALLLAVLWILAALFLLDWLFELDRLLRAITLLVGAGVAVWAFRRYALPWLGQKETELDMALLVEHQEHIDTDLIAAVQFESPEAPQWGSVQLEQAVIDGVATTGRRINVMRGVSRKELSRRSIFLALTVIAWCIAGFAFQPHTGVFFNRLLLGSMHYPTKTVIESITISGHQVDPTNPGRTPIKLRYGEPVSFEVCCRGELPDQGEAKLTAARSRLRTTLTLEPAAEGSRTYTADLPRLVDSVRYQIFLGDAWTDPGRLGVGLLPNVEVELEVEPPDYAKADPNAEPVTMPRGLRQISVIEGSRVLLRLFADKPLSRATLSIDQQDYALKRGDSNQSELWLRDDENLPADAPKSPLAAVIEPIRYQIQVTDTEGLELERPIEGVVRIRADSPPRVAAAIVTQYVLPGAVPTVYLRATDDYGIARLAIDRKVIRIDGQTEESQSEIYRLPSGQPPKKDLESNYPFDLTPLELKRGDRVEITLQAVDYRGPRAGKSAAAETLVFQVTDEQGILEHMAEADRQSARQLKTMIQRQLGIGESP